MFGLSVWRMSPTVGRYDSQGFVTAEFAAQLVPSGSGRTGLKLEGILAVQPLKL